MGKTETFEDIVNGLVIVMSSMLYFAPFNISPISMSVTCTPLQKPGKTEFVEFLYLLCHKYGYGRLWTLSLRPMLLIRDLFLRSNRLCVITRTRQSGKISRIENHYTVIFLILKAIETSRNKIAEENQALETLLTSTSPHCRVKKKSGRSRDCSQFINHIMRAEIAL